LWLSTGAGAAEGGEADTVAGGAGAAAGVSITAAEAGGEIVGSSSTLAGGLLVRKSTVTRRVGSGARGAWSVAVDAGAEAGLGPDKSSGTTNTINTTKIEAPIRRSLTRLSI
jgi:hypothetical protein